LLVNHLHDRRQVKRFVFCLLLTAFIVAMIGISHIPGGWRVTAPFEGRVGEPNTFGGHLLFIGMVVAGLVVRVKDVKSHHLFIALLICLVSPFFFT
jgi:hypothetical protein